MLFIRIKHGEFQGVELAGEVLAIQPMLGKSRVLQENVKDLAIAVFEEKISIVAFLEQDYAWFFTGSKEFGRTRIELSQPYGGGGRLIFDGLGQLHLFYYVKQSPGSGLALKHQIYQEEWSTPALVSTNVFGERLSYTVAWHDDQYLHLAYLNSKGQQLLYRAYNPGKKLWSGAVPFSDQRCNYPQFISADKLYLFWLEEREKTQLQMRSMGQMWSGITRISTGANHASNVGYLSLDQTWQILWGEGEEFFKAPFGEWANHEKIDRSSFDYAWFAGAQGTLPIYLDKTSPPAETHREPKVEVPPEVTPVVRPQVVTVQSEEENARKKRESEEAKVQAAFMEQAFRTLQEWEKLRPEIQRWRAEFRLPEPVDLIPLTSRLDRFERRLSTLQQAQEQSKKQLETSLGQFDQELRRLRNRLQALEDEKKVSQDSLWRRVLKRL